MSVPLPSPSPFLINSFSSFLLISYQVFCRLTSSVFGRWKLPSVKPKLKSGIDVD